MCPTSSRAGLVAALLLAGTGARAQPDDLTQPPATADAVPEVTSPTPSPATRTRLAEPTTEDRNEAMEEILVVRESPWRLPDLGSEWRAREAERQRDERITAEFLPLWDPESERPFNDLWTVNTEMQRVGYIELFRIRFGRH